MQRPFISVQLQTKKQIDAVKLSDVVFTFNSVVTFVLSLRHSFNVCVNENKKAETNWQTFNDFYLCIEKHTRKCVCNEIPSIQYDRLW